MTDDGKSKRHLVSSRDVGWFSNALYSMSAWILHFIYNTVTAILPESHRRKGDSVMKELLDDEENSCNAEGTELIPEIQINTSRSVKLVAMVVDSVIFGAVCIFLILCTYAIFAYI